MRAMNSRWLSFQGSTIKRVSQMENEKLRAILKELGHARDQGRNADHLLWLIKRLQRRQALGPPASRARLPSEEISYVARAVEKYLDRTMCTSTASTETSTPVIPSTSGGLLHCKDCSRTVWSAIVETVEPFVIHGKTINGRMRLTCCNCGYHTTADLQ
jgi:hypothetical protein